MMKDFEKATELFKQYQEIYPKDSPAEIYLIKCKVYQQHPEAFSNAIEMENK